MCFAARAPGSFARLDLWCAGLAADCVRQPAPGRKIIFPRPDDYTWRRTVVDARVDVKALISAPRWVGAVLDGFARCLLLRGRSYPGIAAQRDQRTPGRVYAYVVPDRRRALLSSKPRGREAFIARHLPAYLEQCRAFHAAESGRWSAER